MSTFVLLHGAWHGGWCWQRVAPLLRAAGHEVYTPTFTGCADRSHLISPQTGLDTHVQDVVGLLDYQELRDVRLVGHSYAGQVVSAVSGRRPDAVGLRVYLDAFVGAHGDRAIDLLPPGVAAHYRNSVAGPGFGWLIPPRSLTVLGVSEQSDLDWIEPKLTPHPWRSYEQPLDLPPDADRVPGAYLDCTDWMAVFAPFARVAAEKGWPVHPLATGHEAMVTAPHELARALLRVDEDHRARSAPES